MIHRDVSPSNVMLSYEGAVKLLDFGIAKALGGEKEESGTQRGTLKGKFAYMAPEQTQGSDVDKRIDIFATGIVLHEVLTGRRLFKGENDLQTVEKVRQCDVPPPSVQNPLCPPELDAIILKALSKNRDDRFLTASDMADALDDVVHAARFQPTHLAQLMRDLFPTDAGAGVTGTQRAVSQSLSGSSSRPHSVAMRSPTTVPPVSVSRSSASMYKITPVPPPEAPPVPPPPPPTPVYKRGAFWGALFAVGAAFGGGVLYTRSQAPARVAGPREDRPRSIGKQQVLIQSLPDGAQILEYGTNKELGVTPKWLTFDFDKGPVRVVLRKTGFQDTERDVKAHVPLMVYLPQVNNPQPGRKGTPTDKPAADKPSGSDKPAGSDKGSGTDKGDKGSTAVPPGPSEAPPSSKPSSPSRPSATGARPSAPAPSAPSASAPPPKPAAPDPAPTAGTTPRPAPAATPPKPKKSVNDIVDPF
jgi:serine/threonine-protein kinase